MSIFYSDSLIDYYLSLKILPNLFNADDLVPLKPAVSHILSTLMKDQIFHLLPSSNLGPLNPRNLPREISINDAFALPIDPNAPKKKGRPTKRDKARKTRSALDSLGKWLDKTTDFPAYDAPTSITEYDYTTMAYPSSLRQYQIEKSRLLESIKSDSHPESSRAQLVVEQANRFVLDRLKLANQLESVPGLLSSTENANVARVECAVTELSHAAGNRWGGGALSLLGGREILQMEEETNS